MKVKTEESGSPQGFRGSGGLAPLPAWQEKKPSQITLGTSTLGTSSSSRSSAPLGRSGSEISASGSIFSGRSRHVARSAEVRLLRDKPMGRRVTPARRHIVDWLLGTYLGQYVCLTILYALLLCLSSLAWMAVDGTDVFPADSWKACFWIAYALIFDPGTQTGLWENQDTKTEVLWVAGFISGFGFIWMLVFLGMVIESIRTLLSFFLTTRSRIVMTGHIVILGWSDKTVYLLKEMFLEAQNRRSHGQQIIILSMNDESDMLQAVNDHIGRRPLFVPLRCLCYCWCCCRRRPIASTGRRRRDVVHCRRGCPYDKDELLRVSVGSASDIIVLGKAGPPRESDLEVVRVILGLAALPGGSGEPTEETRLSGRVIAEVKSADTAPVLEALLAPDPQTGLGARCEGIHARSTVNRMLCLMAVKPVVGDLLALLSSFEYGEEMYCVDASSLNIKTFGEACRAMSVRDALCIGIKPEEMQALDDTNGAASPQVILAPDDSRPIDETDRLLVIAADEVSITEEIATLEHQAKTHHILKHVGTLVPQAARSPSFAPRRLDSEAHTMAVIHGDAAAVESMPPRMLENVATRESSGGVFIIIGWPDDFRDLIMSLDKYVSKGTDVHILSSRLDDDPLRLRHKDNLKKSPPKNVTLKYHTGSSTSVDTLLSLPLDADAILIMAEESCQDDTSKPSGLESDAPRCDAATVTCAVMICGICEGKYGRDKTRPLHGRIICEVLDPRTDRMLRRNVELRNKITFFRSNALETGLFAMAASEPTIFNTLMHLFSPTHDLGKLVSEPVTKYTAARELNDGLVVHLSFWDLHESVRANQGDLLLGWHRLEEGRTTLGCQVNRSLPITFSAKDRLLVLRRQRKGSVPRARAQQSLPEVTEQESPLAARGMLSGDSGSSIALVAGDQSLPAQGFPAEKIGLALRPKDLRKAADEQAPTTANLASSQAAPAPEAAVATPLTVVSAKSAEMGPPPTAHAEVT